MTKGGSVYYGCFLDYEQMLAEWGDIQKQPVPTQDEVLFASYGAESYEGDAVVIFTHAGQLYEVHGSHCSCFGLNEAGYMADKAYSQWAPEATTWAALDKYTPDQDQHSEEAIKAFKALVAKNLEVK